MLFIYKVTSGLEKDAHIKQVIKNKVLEGKYKVKWGNENLKISTIYFLAKAKICLIGFRGGG